MKKAVIIISSIGSLLIILESLNAGNSLTLFLLAGVVPGTNIRIPAIDMMAATATAITIIVLRLTAWPHIKSFAQRLVRIDAPVSPAAKRTVRRIV